jgi:hypothetical protein
MLRAGVRARWIVRLVATGGVVSLLLATPVAAEIHVQWVRGEAGARLEAVATSRDGLSAVTGTKGTPGTVQQVMLLRTFGADGGAGWSVTWRPTKKDSWTVGTSVDISSAGRVFVAGDLWTALDWDAPTSWFVRTYAPDGRLLWSRLAAGWREHGSSSSASGIAAWPGGVVLSGSICGEGGCYGGWVRSYARDGTLRWVRKVGGAYGSSQDVAVTDGGVVYVTGAFTSSPSGPMELGDTTFVTRLSPGGRKGWTHRFDGSEWEGRAVAIQPHGVTVGGTTPAGAWLASLRDDGRARWLRRWDGQTIADLDVAPSGSIWLTGRARRPGGPTALIVRTYGRDGALRSEWTKDPADFAAEGTGIRVDRLGVSVTGRWGRSGRLWRLSN